MKLELPPTVNGIIERLEQGGYEAYAVGGCVRDSLLGKIPSDWDITTSAEPFQVKKLFSHTVDTGIDHGTVTVFLGKEGFEVTTYRIDGKYEDSRHPSEVTFTKSLEEDLKRRDFTVNAMAYNDRVGLVDVFGGVSDLSNRMIRCVGKAEERFGEDALRMFRAVRFAAQLDFFIEEETTSAITRLAYKLKEISAERIQAELIKLLVSENPREVRSLYGLGISEEIFPWLDTMMEMPQKTPYHSFSVGEHTVESLAYVEKDKVLRLTMLFHDIGKPSSLTIDENGQYHFKGHPQVSAKMARGIMKDLKFDNKTMEEVCTLVRWHDDKPALTPASVRRAIYRIGEEHFPKLFLVKRADAMAKSDLGRAEELMFVDAYENLYREVVEESHCFSLKDLAVSGGDLIALGIPQGPEVGEALHYLMGLVLECPEDNVREILLERLKEKA